MSGLHLGHEFDPPNPPPDAARREYEEEQALIQLNSEDCYWDLGSSECLRYRLDSQTIKSTSPQVTPYCPKNTFKELPSKQVTENIEPSSMIEQINIDVTDYILLEPKRFEYDSVKKEILHWTTLDAEADQVVTEIIEFLAKMTGQSLVRYKEFGLMLPEERRAQGNEVKSAVKGRHLLSEFAYFHREMKEYPVELAFLPVWDQYMEGTPQHSNAPVLLRVRLTQVLFAKHVIPTFTMHNEILLNVSLRTTLESIIHHCLVELERATSGRVQRDCRHQLGLVLDDQLYAGDVELRRISTLSDEREQDKNEAKLIILSEDLQSFRPDQPLRKWTVDRATLKVDVSQVFRLAGPRLQLNEEYKNDDSIRTLDVQIATLTVTTSLLSPPAWLLNEVLNTVKLVYGVQIAPKDTEKELVLKDAAEELYLTEDHQLQYYDCIRNTVAEDQPINLKLVEGRLKSEAPALNFFYQGEMPLSREISNLEDAGPPPASEPERKEFTFTVKRLDNLQALFKHLDQVIPNEVRSKEAKGCLGRCSKKLTPRYISPDVVLETKGNPVPDIVDLSQDSPREFVAQAERMLKTAGVNVKLKPTMTIHTKLLIGDEVVPGTDKLELALQNTLPQVNSNLKFENLPLKNFPYEIRLGLEIKSGNTVIACVCMPLFDDINGEFRPHFGETTLKLWPFHCICADYVTMLEFKGINLPDAYATITIDIPRCDYRRTLIRETSAHVRFDLFQLNRLAELMEYNLIQLEQQRPGNREITYVFRHLYKMHDFRHVYFLNNVIWTDVVARDEVVTLISKGTFSPEDALCLLSCQFYDARIRQFMVSKLETMENQDLANYIPQLAQALFFELRHNSALEKFLMRRALADPYEVGHQFFWCLRSQFAILPYRERLRLVIERFAMRCGNYRQTLATEIRVVNLLRDQAALVRKGLRKDPDFVKNIQKLLLEQLPAEFTIPTSTTRILLRDGLECYSLDSKLKPLRFKFRVKGCQGKMYQAMLKVGDDMRQDMLILQVFRIMQKIWRDARLPVRLKTYRVVAIDQRSGMIEMVPDSSQISAIHAANGLLSSRSTWLHDYIRSNNADHQSLKRARANFMISCACYCVGTYLLGIGDRHDGNIMLDKNGVLFHIDFGHILGNFKKKWFIRREHYKVKYSEDMHTVLDIANNYESFLSLIQELYNAIRAKGHLVFYLMKMMATGAMPELKGYEDLNYLVKRLKMEKSDRQVKDVLRTSLEKSKKSVMRRIDRCAHNVKHFMVCRCDCFGSSSSSS